MIESRYLDRGVPMHKQTHDGLQTLVWRKKVRGGRKNIPVRGQNGRKRKRRLAAMYFAEQKEVRERQKMEARRAKLISKGKLKP